MSIQSRAQLKTYFETGDKPTEEEFGHLIDSMLNRNDDNSHLGLKQHDPNRTGGYKVGDTVIKDGNVWEADEDNQGVWNESKWSVVLDVDTAVTHTTLTNNPHQVDLEQARSQDNTVAGDIDMDGNYLLNVPVPTLAGHAANKSWVESLLSSFYEDKGDLDCSTNPSYPAGEAGDTYYVSVAGKVGGASGKDVEVGDVIKCRVDNAGGDEATVGSSWYVVAGNVNKANDAMMSAGTDNLHYVTPKLVADYYQPLDDDLSGLSGLSTTGLVKRTGAGAFSTITDNSNNWDTAYGWGDHGSVGYLSDITGEMLSDLSDVDAYGAGQDGMIPYYDHGSSSIKWKSESSGNSIYSANDTIGSGRLATITDSLTFYQNNSQSNDPQIILEQAGSGDAILRITRTAPTTDRVADFMLDGDDFIIRVNGHEVFMYDESENKVRFLQTSVIIDNLLIMNNNRQILLFPGASIIGYSNTYIDLEDSAYFKLPRSGTPDIAHDGKIAIDAAITDLTDMIVYHSTEDMIVLAMPTDNLDLQDGYVCAYNATNDEFEMVAAGGGGGMSDLVDDTTPQLGGDLDVNAQKIVSASGGDIVIQPDGFGKLIMNGDFKFGDGVSADTFYTTDNYNGNKGKWYIDGLGLYSADTSNAAFWIYADVASAANSATYKSAVHIDFEGNASDNAGSYVQGIQLTSGVQSGSDEFAAIRIESSNWKYGIYQVESAVDNYFAGKMGVGVTPLTNMAAGDLVLEGGSLALKEITTPTADTGYGKIYTKADNVLYFQDGAGTEHAVADSDGTTGGSGSAGAGLQYVEIRVAGTTYKVLHDGTA